MVEGRATELKVAHVGGIDVILTPAWAAGTLILIVFFSGVGHYLFHHGFANAIAGGIVLAACHWVSEVVHNVGHSTAARRTGHPMTATRLGFLLVLGLSVYPEDEPGLPPEVHISRAMGGPAGSAILTAALGVLAFLTAGSSLGWVVLVWFLDNLLVFTLGAFLPLGFNDGSTLIRWMRRRQANG